MNNRHYHIINDDITNITIKGRFYFITCISVFEHIEDPDAAVFNMFNLFRTSGHLLFTFPFKEENYVRNLYELLGSTHGKSNPYNSVLLQV